MDCLHPSCPAGNGASSWKEVVEQLPTRLREESKRTLLTWLNSNCSKPPTAAPVGMGKPDVSDGILKALFRLCPCLFNQVQSACSPRGVVHFCELTLGRPIDNHNVHEAFLIQHPKKGPPYRYPPLIPCSDGGTIMEMLCSELLAANGIPAMEIDSEGWPVWTMPGHVLLNEGGMSALRAFGDILVPCGPTNLVISVKSEAARERLLYSSNSIEGIGFGFFNEAKEFWTQSRMNLYKRMGFSAIYMPSDTLDQVNVRLDEKGLQSKAVNINGSALYRSLGSFGPDMKRIVGRHSLGL